MANAPSLVALAAAAEAVAHEAKAERAKAMDAMVDLLFERAQMRDLMRQSLPYLRPIPIVDVLVSEMEAMLND